MKHRVFSVIAAVTVFFSCLVLPVSAVNESGWIELLETNSVQANGDNWFTISGTSGSVTIPVGAERRFRKIDMLIWNQSGQRPATAKVSGTSLQIYAVGTYLTRIVGNVPNTWYENVTVSFTKSTSVSQTYEVLSCKMSALDVQEFVCDASVVIGSKTYSTGTQINISAADDITNTNTSLIRIDVKDWQKYDEISIWGSALLMSIDSIRASISTSGLPLTTNYFSCTDAGADFNFDGMLGETEPEYGRYLFCITIDLSNVDRTKTDALYVYITGQWNKQYGPSFTCQYVNGHIFTADTSNVTFWVYFKNFFNSLFSGLTSTISNGFSNVNTWITNQTNTLKSVLTSIWQEIEDGFDNVGSWFEQYFGQDATDAEEFQDDAAEKVDEMEDLNEQLQEVTKPPVSDIETDLDDYVDPGTVTSVSTKLGALTGDPLIVSMLMITLTVALVSYVLFGKR